jgi:hypothetical protein
MEMLTEDETQLIIDLYLKRTYANPYVTPKISDELVVIRQLESKCAVYITRESNNSETHIWLWVVLNCKHPDVERIVDAMEMLDML